MEDLLVQDSLAPKVSNRPDRFAWLFGAESRPARIPYSPEQLDPACQLLLRNWNVLPVTSQKLLDWSLPEAEGTKEINRIRDVTRAVRALARMQLMLVARFSKALETLDIPHVVMKGSAASLALYPEPDLRSGLDIDVGVPKRYVRDAEAVAYELGFLPAAFDEENRHATQINLADKEAVEAIHYELACLNRRQIVRGLDPEDEAAIRNSIPFPRPWHETEDGELACYVTLDIHHGICLDISVDQMVETATRQTLHGYSVWVPQPEWMMLHLIFKLYWEGVHRFHARGLYQYADLIRLVPRIRGTTAQRLFDLLANYELEAGAYYVLRVVKSEFGVDLTPELQEFLKETTTPPYDRAPSEVNDQGDMWPRLWGFR